MFQMKSISELTTCAQFPPEVFMTKTKESDGALRIPLSFVT